MQKEDIIEQLKEIVKPYIQNQAAFDSLTENTDFINDLKINSANLVDVILDIEEKYNIVIDNDSMERMVNVKAAIYTIAVAQKEDLQQISTINIETKISKIDGIPSIIDESTLISHPVSITHHGRFWEGITLIKPSI